MTIQRTLALLFIGFFSTHSALFAQCTTGDCTDGFGVYKYEAGHTYEGEWKEKKRHGSGTFTFAAGQRQFGQWENGQLVDGTTYFSNGTQYTGAYLNSAKHGSGSLLYPDGHIQQGQFHQDTLVLGFIKSPSGTYYYGDAQGNLPNGFGTMYYEGKEPVTGWWTAQQNGVTFQEQGPEKGYIEPDEIYTEPVAQSSTAKGMVDDLYENTFAVIVGVEDYPGERNDLNYTRDDAELFYNFLSSAEGGSVPSQNMKYLFDSDATSDRIVAAMDELYSKAGINDRIIFYFSGHGRPGEFCSYDEKSLSHGRVKAAFSRSKAQYKLCFADACHAGSIKAFQANRSRKTSRKGAFVNKALGTSTVTTKEVGNMFKAFGEKRSNIAVMMSSKAEEYSQEISSLGHGVFTYCLVRAMMGDANLNNDKVVDITEAFIYVRKNVASTTNYRQSPILFGTFSKYMPISQVR